MQSPLIVALDCANRTEARALLSALSPDDCRVKIGKGMFTQYGPAWVEEVMTAGFEVFLDLKFHDIPNTVHHAVKSASALGVWMLTLHAQGGRAMLAAAKEAVAGVSRPPLLVAVTVLTSLSSAALMEVGCANTVDDQVCRLAELAAETGIDGVVCSPQELTLLSQRLSLPLLKVTPGIRAAVAAGDQQRVASPAQALRWGADYLVVGREITAASDPAAALAHLVSLSTAVD